MFSNIGGIFKTEPRRAETTDTRQGIRHHDPDYERRKNKKKERENPVDFDDEDNAIVSVEALRVFLANFLKSADSEVKVQKPEDRPAEIKAPELKRPEDRKPVSGQAAQAASAYEHSARARGGSYDMGEGDNSVTVAQSLGLGSDEVRTIHALLEDLKMLSERRIEYLRIERSDSFLHSLVDAVAKLKH